MTHISKDVTDGVPLKMWTEGVPVEFAAQEQLEKVARVPGVFRHIAVMPDVHFGAGATVGSVIAMQKAIIPAAVGVDIGCGMEARKLGGIKAHQLPTNLKLVRDAIEASVPVGRAHFDDKTLPKHNSLTWRVGLKGGYDRLCSAYPEITKDTKPAIQLGTLGGGNHFIELCIDEADDVWLMLHSGSRGIGNRIGSHFISLAKKDMERHQIQLPDKDLAYLSLGSDVFDDYMMYVTWAQDYARLNRACMMHSVLEALKNHVGFPTFGIENKSGSHAVACHHNYISRETHFGENVYVTRKGAVRADLGMLGIIPGSMGAKSFIVRGKGEPDSYCSCSHGAGRSMSRGEAKRRFTVADHVLATQGIECRKDESVVDETPGAYKDIDNVMAAQSDLVDVVHTLRQIVCVKG
ncbi:MAG: ligase [Sphingomonadales bacterium]|nr:ligase [Sphingomonadales bacterium]